MPIPFPLYPQQITVWLASQPKCSSRWRVLLTAKIISIWSSADWCMCKNMKKFHWGNGLEICSSDCSNTSSPILPISVWVPDTCGSAVWRLSLWLCQIVNTSVCMLSTSTHFLVWFSLLYTNGGTGGCTPSSTAISVMKFWWLCFMSYKTLVTPTASNSIGWRRPS